MSSFSALNTIARSLQAQIVAALNSAPDIDLAATLQSVPLGPPSEHLSDDVLAVLYLYHVDIDPHTRNRKLIADPANPSLMIRPPLPLHLRFLFVPLSEEDERNQLILGRVLQHFHDAPTFRPPPGTALASSRGGGPVQLRVRFDLASYQELAQLWSSLSRPYRLSAGFLVEIATIDSALAPTETPRTGIVLGVTRRVSEGTGE